MDETATPQQVDAEARQILEFSDGIGVRDVTSYDLKVIARLRKDYPQKVMGAHSSENLAEEKKSVALTGEGQTARHLDWGPDFLVHLIHAPIKDLERMAQLGITAVSCPRVNGTVGDGLPDLGLWVKIGLSFALGTDNMMFNAPNMLREMDYASRMVRGLRGDTTIIDTLTILQAATIVGARALKLDKDLGSLSPGKEASFIVFDLNSPNLTYQHNPISAIVHRATTSDISQIYVKGKPLEEYLH
jgi:cytosine/adenosine deaminase-related metal-dependent hydrolase